jgi:hypothetical protein
MRERVNGEALEHFMKAVGRAGRTNARIYFVGGAAVEDFVSRFREISGS